MRLFLVVALAGCASHGGFRPSEDAGDAATMGAFYVLQRGCPTCHDSAAGTLAGRDTAIPGTMSYAANLTPDHDTGIGDWSDEEIVRAMRMGIDDEGVPLCPPMPHFDGTGGDGRPMEDVEATDIIAYLRSLPPVHHEVPESSCAQKGNTLDLSIADLSTTD